MKRLENLEKRAVARQSGKVTVKFANGEEKRMLLADTIPLLSKDTIVDVTGDGSRESGRLWELIRGVIAEPPGEIEL